MSRVDELYKKSEYLFQENKVEIETTKKTIEYLNTDKSLVEKELAEAKKQVGLLSSDLKEVRENLKKETLKLKKLSKEQKVLANTVKMLNPMPDKILLWKKY